MSWRDNKLSRNSERIREMCIFSMLAAIMFCSKIAMEALPNIHLVGILTVVYTLVFRVKALIPIYLYVFINGLYAGFDVWWIPYLYIWTVLWAAVMLFPKKMPRKAAAIIYPVIACLHGIAFGTLYAPIQALVFGFDFEMTLAWIAAGLTFDVVHAIGNLVLGFLILPLSDLLFKLVKRRV